MITVQTFDFSEVVNQSDFKQIVKRLRAICSEFSYQIRGDRIYCGFKSKKVISPKERIEYYDLILGGFRQILANEQRHDLSAANLVFFVDDDFAFYILTLEVQPRRYGVNINRLIFESKKDFPKTLKYLELTSIIET